MEYLILLLLIIFTQSMNVANSTMPLRNNLRVPVVAELDVTTLNKELKEYIDTNVKDQINQTCNAKVEKAVKDSLSDLKSDLLEKFEGIFAGLHQKITAQSTSLEERLRKENKELNHSLTIEISQSQQRLTAQFKNLEDLLFKVNTYIKNNLRTEIDKLNLVLLQPLPVDCSDLIGKTSKSGVYLIHPVGSLVFKTYCDMETDGGGWTVFQRRINGQTDFYRGWNDYKNGFGDPHAEFWMGNSRLAIMTFHRQYELRINLEDFNGSTAYAKYSTFFIGDESTKYRITVDGYSGTVGDSLAFHNNHAFSTKDNDNDAAVNGNCAIERKGAWWYNFCHYSNLNGLYLGNTNSYTGINWRTWYESLSLKFASMMIRRKRI